MEMNIRVLGDTDISINGEPYVIEECGSLLIWLDDELGYAPAWMPVKIFGGGCGNLSKINLIAATGIIDCKDGTITTCPLLQLYVD